MPGRKEYKEDPEEGREEVAMRQKVQAKSRDLPRDSP